RRAAPGRLDRIFLGCRHGESRFTARACGGRFCPVRKRRGFAGIASALASTAASHVASDTSGASVALRALVAPGRAAMAWQAYRMSGAQGTDAGAGSELRIECVRTAAALQLHRDAMEVLARGALEANPFYEPWMLFPAMEAFDGGDLHVVLAWLPSGRLA